MKIKTSKKLSNRLRPIFLTAFFDGFILWYAAEKLFMKSIGFSDQQIALNAVIYAAIIIAVNVPAGILADRWSRKGVLAISSLSLITGTLISGSSNAFWPYILGTAFWGLYFAIQSGIYESVIYDTLVEETGKPTGFEKYLGRVRLLMSAGLVAGSFASSLVVSLLNLRATYYLTIPFTVISLIALLRFREPTVHRQGERQHITAHASEMVRVLFSRV
ncbi:MFS transporter, partial [Candidatus Saccharibacteria bacterium]|nr:MFS transporter [Candidatus Saccharibacteria bacterium]